MIDREERVSFLNTLGETQLGKIIDYIDDETYKVRLDNGQIYSVKHEHLTIEDEEPVGRFEKYKKAAKVLGIAIVFVAIVYFAYLVSTYRPEQTPLQKDTADLNALNNDSVFYIEQCGKLKEADEKKKEILQRINILKPIFP